MVILVITWENTFHIWFHLNLSQSEDLISSDINFKRVQKEL